MLIATNGDKLDEFKEKYIVSQIMRYGRTEWRCVGEQRSNGFKSVKNGVPVFEEKTEYFIYLKYNDASDPNVQAIVNDLGPYYYDCGLLAVYIGETEHEVLADLPKLVIASDEIPHPTKIMEFLGWGYDEDNIWNSYF